MTPLGNSNQKWYDNKCCYILCIHWNSRDCWVWTTFGTDEPGIQITQNCLCGVGNSSGSKSSHLCICSRDNVNHPHHELDPLEHTFN